jgi:OHCU decarboxylase
VRRISDLPDAEAAAELAACCASARWVTRMLSQRPFKDATEVFESAERIWRDITPADWLEAFRAHPRIGERHAKDAQAAQGAPRGRGWSEQEQSGMKAASDDVRAELARANAEYERKFGWIFIVCASGKSPEEMLAMCSARMANDPDAELKIAAEEQLKITRLRLEKLLTV